MTDKKKDPIPYRVLDKVTGDVVYALGNSRAQVRTFAAHNRFDVAPLTVKEALGITAKDLLDATGELSPDQAALDLRPKGAPQ